MPPTSDSRGCHLTCSLQTQALAMLALADDISRDQRQAVITRAHELRSDDSAFSSQRCVAHTSLQAHSKYSSPCIKRGLHTGTATYIHTTLQEMSA